MKKSKYSETQIATALRQVEAGAPIAEVTRSLVSLAEEVRADGGRDVYLPLPPFRSNMDLSIFDLNCFVMTDLTARKLLRELCQH